MFARTTGVETSDAGAITQGFRLRNAAFARCGAGHDYSKGAYIVHMLA